MGSELPRVWDGRRTSWFFIDNEIVDTHKLSDTADSLYMKLCRHANNQTGESRPSLRKWAKEKGIGWIKVKAATDELIEKKLIRVVKAQHGKPKIYIILDVKGDSTSETPVKDSVSTSDTDKGLSVSTSETEQNVKKNYLEEGRSPYPFFFLIGLRFWRMATGQKRQPKAKLWSYCRTRCADYGRRIIDKDPKMGPENPKPADYVLVGWTRAIRYAVMGYAHSSYHQDLLKTEGRRIWSLEKLFSDKKEEIEKYYREYHDIVRPKKKKSGLNAYFYCCPHCGYKAVIRANRMQTIFDSLPTLNCDSCQAKLGERVKMAPSLQELNKLLTIRAPTK